ncbi:MAG TPA: hypothetical protein PK431_07490 [Chitinophagales bacterium]|nr:hypothetical protein [Chitinophagales bacterium]
MGWKASTIIIHKPTQIDNEELLQELGFGNLTKIEDEPFEVAINPDENKVYIGSYKDNLLICAPDIPMQFFEDFETPTERILKEKFPNSEICSIILQSTVNLWGYSVTVNGQKIRARAGSSDDGTFVELGEPLDEEKELLSKSKLDENGNRIYLLDDFPDEPFNEDQVGENFVFSICKRYFDEELDSADDLLFDTTLTGYKYKKTTKKETNTTKQEQQKTNETNPWWKFW